MLKKNYIFIISIIVLFSSCFEKDKMLPAPEPGDVNIDTIPMTHYYANQVYFNLGLAEQTGLNEKSAFDLNFECYDTSTIIRLNTANFAVAAITNETKLEAVTDTTGLEWKFDGSTGSLDSLAIFNWISIEDGDTVYSNKVYVINRGISPLGINLGLIKIRFDSLIGTRYYFTHSNMDNSELTKGIVQKNSGYINTQYSVITKEQVQYEPFATDWDLLFTQYTCFLFTNEGDKYPYLVTGVLQKYNILEVAFDSTMAFSDITIADTGGLDFSYEFDKIGYNWKELKGDINSGNIRYEARLNYNYIIRDESHFFYKLRFVNFYDLKTGDKGYPTIEYQRL